MLLVPSLYSNLLNHIESSIMKRAIIFSFLIFGSIILHGQQIQDLEPFILKGLIINYPKDYKCLNIDYLDNNGVEQRKEIPIDESGHFNFTTHEIVKPQQIRIWNKQLRMIFLFAAPGYNLTINAKWNDFKIFYKTKEVSGIGSESNRYNFIFDSILMAQKEPLPRFFGNESHEIKGILKERNFKDSIAHAVFDKKSNQDKYLDYFGKVVRYDNEFTMMNNILGYCIEPKTSYEDAVSIVQNNFNKEFLDHPSRDEYMVNDVYKNHFLNRYLNYLTDLDYRKDSTLLNIKGYELAKAVKIYDGQVRQSVLYDLMENTIRWDRDLDHLIKQNKVLKPYLPLLNPQQRKEIESLIALRQNELTTKEAKFPNSKKQYARSFIGKPAPTFALENDKGKTFKLEDFKGKVVLLDLWASWCDITRSERPYLKELTHKYKREKRIAIISIAVYDSITEWKKALKEDKPDWIQLFDKDGVVLKAYVEEHLPKFILIDKKGIIVNYNAPRPSNGKELEELIDEEMKK